MKATLAPLQLEFYGVDNVSVRSNPAFSFDEAGEGKPCPRIELAIQDMEEPNEFMVSLEVHIEEGGQPETSPEAVPYFIDVELMGVFQIRGEVEEKIRSWLMGFNAPAILYGIARAEMAHLTEHSRFGVFVLPSVDFIGMAKRELSSEQVQEEAAAED